MNKDREAALLLWGALEAVTPFLPLSRQSGLRHLMASVAMTLFEADVEVAEE